MTDEFQDYSSMMTTLEKAMRKMHDHCLLKEWSKAAEYPGEMILELAGLAEWLESQRDGHEAK